MKSKFNSLEKKWIMYDAGNSAFTMLVTTIMPIYFNELAKNQGISEVNYLAYWGYATTISTLIVALLAPFFGTVSDFPGWKKKLFSISLLFGSVGCIFLGIVQSWLWFLLLFVFAKSAYSLNLVFYDSMLTDVTSIEKMNTVSASGYAWGYIGSCIPFVLSLVVVLFYETIGIPFNIAMFIAFLLTALWWLALSFPLWKNYKQKNFVETTKHPLSESFIRLSKIFTDLKKNKKILFFLIAFFFYIDGVYTIIDMATAYGTALGLNSSGLLLALLVTQIVAFPTALIFGKLSTKVKSSKLILVCIIAYFFVVLYGTIMKYQYQFWILAVCVGAFQGGIQSLSRSYFASIIPQNKSGEYFGIYDICGKGASILGTFLVSFISQLSGNINTGVGVLAIMFVIGGLFFIKTNKIKKLDENI